MQESLVELCFDKMEEARCEPEEVGLPEPVGIQYYRRIAEKEREKSRQVQGELSKIKDEYSEAVSILADVIEDGEHIVWLLERIRDGTFRCCKCSKPCMIQVSDGGAPIYPHVLREPFFKVASDYFPTFCIQWIPYVVKSMCIYCWHEEKRAEGTNGSIWPLVLFKKCQMCRKRQNTGFSLIPRNIYPSIDTEPASPFYVEQVREWDGDALYVNSACGDCWYHGIYPEESHENPEHSKLHQDQDEEENEQQ